MEEVYMLNMHIVTYFLVFVLSSLVPTIVCWLAQPEGERLCMGVEFLACKGAELKFCKTLT
jgi:hypothetical protein